MTLHRSSSSTFSSSSHPSTLLLHPLDIHFLAEPYGLPQPGPAQPPLPPPTSTPSNFPPPTSTPSNFPPPTSTPSNFPPPTSTPSNLPPPTSTRSNLPPPTSTQSTLPPPSTPLSLGFPRDPPKPPKAPLSTPAAHINTQSCVNTRTRPPTVVGPTDEAFSLPTTPHAHASSLPATPPAHASSLPTTPTTPPAHVRSLPKVQVCGRGGVWWALNAGVLFLYRQLYDQGLCSCIKAEVVPLHKVPGPLQTAMVVDGEDVDETRSLLPGQCVPSHHYSRSPGVPSVLPCGVVSPPLL
ncbi:uncharacterized protein [Panulirus ornatus]|uniref:uncharacterized protein n=1 Tax=Panulirus ornatus TaxID=150431 RepID=UPI003A8B43D6